MADHALDTQPCEPDGSTSRRRRRHPSTALAPRLAQPTGGRAEAARSAARVCADADLRCLYTAIRPVLWHPRWLGGASASSRRPNPSSPLLGRRRRRLWGPMDHRQRDCGLGRPRHVGGQPMCGQLSPALVGPSGPRIRDRRAPLQSRSGNRPHDPSGRRALCRRSRLQPPLPTRPPRNQGCWSAMGGGPESVDIHMAPVGDSRGCGSGVGCRPGDMGAGPSGGRGTRPKRPDNFSRYAARRPREPAVRGRARARPHAQYSRSPRSAGDRVHRRRLAGALDHACFRLHLHGPLSGAARGGWSHRKAHRTPTHPRGDPTGARALHRSRREW